MNAEGKIILHKFKKATQELSNLFEEHINGDVPLKLWDFYDEIEYYLEQHYKGE